MTIPKTSAFADLPSLREAGFDGFERVRDLLAPGGLRALPRDPGVYVVIRDSTSHPRFIDPGTGGWFKATDPNVRVAALRSKWIDGVPVVYIGMASSIRSRIGQLVRFGVGRPVGHKGGRFLWQLADSLDLLVAWQGDPDPFRKERELLGAFADAYGALTFANLRW
ncbi:MAG: hypothetical protein HYX57_05065 [Chloroflexi bacterium]|nr:hypothetical protein [Chloroflexota bacterium]